MPVQLQIPSIVTANIQNLPEIKPDFDATPSATVLWWKTYSPPRWLVGDNSSLPFRLETRDLMGIPGVDMIQELEKIVPTCPITRDGSLIKDSVFLVAPRSATFLDPYTQLTSSSDPSALHLQELWTYERHVNLDDMDFGDDGVFSTLKRVVGRRGLSVWAVKRAGCL